MITCLRCQRLKNPKQFNDPKSKVCRLCESTMAIKSQNASHKSKYLEDRPVREPDKIIADYVCAEVD